MAKYDVFISYKNTDDHGSKTKDSEIAQRLFELLSKKGVSVFFSDQSLFEQGIGDYKKAIDKALGQSIVLVVIGTNADYISSGWVEHEYETFYEDILSKRKPNGLIISYVENIEIAQMPRTLQRFQAYFMQNLSLEKLSTFVTNALKSKPEKKNAASEKVLTGERLTVSEARGADEFTPLHGSSYKSDYHNELNRLKIQSDNARESDLIALNYLKSLDPWPEDEKIYVIDVGSAYGFVAADRFGSNPRVAKVLCLDNNRRVIERAQILFAENERVVFEVADVDSPTFEDEVRDLMEKHGMPKVHLVYSALLLLHLKDPCRTLRRLRRLMDDDSYIVLRGSDDGSKLCYPYYDLMQEIIAKGITVKNAADRHNGGKQYYQLLNSGFCDVRTFSNMTDISGMNFEEREALFQESFAYRTDAYRMICEKEPDNEQAKQDYEWICDALERFENHFFECGFWYCEYDYMAVAKKSNKVP